MNPKYKRNTVKRMTIKVVFQDGQYANIYSPEREGWYLRLRLGWWLQTLGCYLMFGRKGWLTYINGQKEQEGGNGISCGNENDKKNE